MYAMVNLMNIIIIIFKKCFKKYVHIKDINMLHRIDISEVLMLIRQVHENLEPYDYLRKYNINDISNKFILLAFSTQMIQQKQNKDVSTLI